MNPIVRLAASATPGDRKFILVAGAGVSKDAGVPTAWDLMLKTAGLLYASEVDKVDPLIDLKKWFLQSEYAELPYSELIGQIYPNYPDQQRFLKEYLNDHKTGEAHTLIAELARRGIIRAVVTTNFDHFIEKALEDKGLEPQVISTEEDLMHSEPLIHCKAIRVYKPHGTLGRGALRNTPSDLERLSPKMESGLVRILSDHGVIVLGYAGEDEGMARVLDQRDCNYYPLFWVDPLPPAGKRKELIDRKQYNTISCDGAGQFIRDYLKLIDRLDSLAPETGKGPSVLDLQYELRALKQPIRPIFKEFLQSLLADIEDKRPDFSQFEHYDEAIVNQIVQSLPLTYRFAEASVSASKAENMDALREIYDFFGGVLRLHETPEGFSRVFRESDYDGFRFIGYEMFVSLVASIIRYDHWDLLGEILAEDLFVEKQHQSRYENFVRVSRFVNSLDEQRNRRLNLQRISVMADMLKDRFTNTELSEQISHKEFLEADYFLFVRTVCHEENLQYLYNVWCPRASVWLDHAPSYIVRSESEKYLRRILPATGFTDPEEFTKNLQEKHGAFERYFQSGWKESPLRYVDLSKLGSRK